MWIQVYFLSILCNGLSGFLLFTGLNDDNIIEVGTSDKFSLRNPTFHLILGIICGVTGILKLLLPTAENIVFIGDLIPALAGIAAGIVFIFGIFRQSSAVTGKGTLDRLGEFLLYFKKTLGIALMVIALLHFLFPQALFL